MLEKIKNFFDTENYETQLRHYHWSNIAFSLMKLCSFVMLAYVSLNLSMDMFKAFGSTTKDITFFTLLVIGLELSKTISLIISKSEFIVKKLKNFFIGLGFLFLYIGLAFISIYSGYGFVLVATEKTATSTLAISSTIDIEYYQQKIITLEEKIKSYLPQLSRSDLSIASKSSIEKQIKTWESEKDSYFNTIRELQKESVITQVENKDAVGMFALMSRDMGVDEKTLRRNLMLIMVIVVEITAALMAPSINIIKPKKKEEEIIQTPKKENEKKSSKSSKTENIETTYNFVQKEPEINSNTTIKNNVDLELTKIKEPEDIKEKIKEDITDVIKEEHKHPIRETSFEKFIKGLFNNGTHTYLKDRLEVAKELNMPSHQAIKYHNLLVSKKNTEGIPLIEFRPTTGKWHPNFTEQVILSLYKSGKIKIDE